MSAPAFALHTQSTEFPRKARNVVKITLGMAGLLLLLVVVGIGSTNALACGVSMPGESGQKIVAPPANQQSVDAPEYR